MMDKNQKILVIVLAVVLIASVAYVFLFNNNNSTTIAYINSENGADVTGNNVINSKILINQANGSALSNKVIEAAKNGTPVV